MFSQWIFHNDSLPSDLNEQFALYIKPLVDTYQAIGINAYLRPVNDIHVDNKKIGGTGAAQIEEARVLVGSLMFDFDKATMARVLKVPDEKMRDKIFAGLEQYMVTMADLLPEPPDRDATIALYLEKCAETLDAELVPGEPTERELEIAAELDELLVSDEWLNAKTVLPRQGVKIHEGVSVIGGVFKSPGGLIRATAHRVDGAIAEVNFSGDFTILPPDGLEAIQAAASGDVDGLQDRLEAVYRERSLETPGVLSEHFVDRTSRQLMTAADTFARYAYPPNELGYCGPADSGEVLSCGLDGLETTARCFEGTWPYFELIAGRHGLHPLDERVVEDYWIGGPLTDAIDVRDDGAGLLEALARAGGTWAHGTDDLLAGHDPRPQLPRLCHLPLAGPIAAEPQRPAAHGARSLPHPVG